MTVAAQFRDLATPEVADALDALGVAAGFPGLKPATAGLKLFGPAFTVARATNEDPIYSRAADFIDDVAPGQVVVIDNHGLETSTCWGGILTRYAAKKGLAGTVIHGVHRDSAVIRESAYPVFSRGSFMVTGKGRTRLKAVGVPLTIEGVRIAPNDFLLADDDGVVVIPANLAAEVARRAAEIRRAEARILDLVLEHGVSLAEARKAERYHELSRPDP